jgi:enoyl-CoA hydratase/carnithine racemase
LKPLKMRKPVIASVNGQCYAAAMILAISCDLRLGSENATVGSPGSAAGNVAQGWAKQRWAAHRRRASRVSLHRNDQRDAAKRGQGTLCAALSMHRHWHGACVTFGI